MSFRRTEIYHHEQWCQSEQSFDEDISEQFKITHKNSTAYRPQMNGAVEAANKNIKRILRKMVDNSKNWHEQLPYALLGYRTITRTSTEATPYLLVYGIEAIIPVEVEIPSLKIIQEAERKDAKWVKNRYEQLAMVEEKRMVAVCHGQLFSLLQDNNKAKAKAQTEERDRKDHNEKCLESNEDVCGPEGLGFRVWGRQPGASEDLTHEGYYVIWEEGKLSPRYLSPFKVLRKVGDLAYNLALPPSLSGVHLIFHMPMLKKYHSDGSYIVCWDSVLLDENMSYEEEPIAI
ncbi:uncharacterized protein LOC132607991 [Lycium barbarum]|uniref:uncharacterized protein LOC132607991 n=1 Tax=Lycium barbarum TaxID=112863 RepID=UPI00293E30DB|nr:uncharacterized protein LOC132607991 [Lycium barbarum]